MFKVLAGTTLFVNAPFGKVSSQNAAVENGTWFHDTCPWKGFVTKEDKIYEKEEVLDAVAVHNGREMPLWAKHNIGLGYSIITKNGVYALVKPADLIYLD